MTDPEPTSDQILDWTKGSLSCHPSFYPYSLDDPYYSGVLNDDSWLDICQDLDQELVNNNFTSINHNSALNTTAAPSTLLVEPVISNHQSPPETSKKRKASHEPNPNASQAHNKNQNRQSNEANDGDKVVADQRVSVKKAGSRRGTKLAGSDWNSNSNKEGRWAEQLINPCAIAITVIAPPSDSNQSIEIPFAVGPPGYSSVPQLTAYAKTLNVNLHINVLEAHSLQSLNAQVLGSTPDEILIICAQFRVHQINHHNPDDRTKFLKAMRSLEPKAMILSENDTDCSCNNCGNFATGFSRRVEYLWKFLDSTSAAFKGGDSEERRMIEGETAKTLTYMGEMNERKEKWSVRTHGVGFTGELFGEDAIDGARALLKKYDRHWEMRVEERDGCVGLWWKGQPVSFCSLWTIDRKQNDK